MRPVFDDFNQSLTTALNRIAQMLIRTRTDAKVGLQDSSMTLVKVKSLSKYSNSTSGLIALHALR